MTISELLPQIAPRQYLVSPLNRLREIKYTTSLLVLHTITCTTGTTLAHTGSTNEHISAIVLVQTAGRRHGSLENHNAHVLPSLLRQGYEKVDGQHDVSNQLVFDHSHISYSYGETQHLIQLEFNGQSQLVSFSI